MGLVFAVVTYGISQPVYGRILDHPVSYPTTAGFLFWAMTWFQALPFLLVFGLDSLLRERKGVHAWRAALYVLVILSFLRQLQISYLHTMFPGSYSVRFAGGLILVCLLFLLCWKARRKLDLYFSFLGAFALVLTILLPFRAPLSGFAPSEPEGRKVETTAPPVFLLVFDEISFPILAPDGTPDGERFPHFAELAGESSWFTEATTNHLHTDASVRTIFTGKRWPKDGARTLFDHLGDRYRFRVITAIPSVEDWMRSTGRKDVDYRGRNRHLSRRPLAVASFLLVGLAESAFLPTPIARKVTGFFGDSHTLHSRHREEFEELLRSVDPGESPGRFVYFHASLPHYPYVYDSSGKLHGNPDTAFFPGRDVTQVLRNYVRQLQRVDRLLGRFLERLKETGLWPDSILVVTSDHGLRTQGFLEPEGFPKKSGDLGPRVPLMVRAPSLVPGVLSTPYQHIDFLPSLLEILDVHYSPKEFDGQALSEPRQDRREKTCAWSRESRYRYDWDEGLWILERN